MKDKRRNADDTDKCRKKNKTVSECTVLYIPIYQTDRHQSECDTHNCTDYYRTIERTAAVVRLGSRLSPKLGAFGRQMAYESARIDGLMT